MAINEISLGVVLEFGASAELIPGSLSVNAEWGLRSRHPLSPDVHARIVELLNEKNIFYREIVPPSE